MKDQATRLRELVNKNYKKEHNGESKNISQNGARVITISSGKGGVGKTNFTVNLGISLAKMGKKVIVIDADLGLSNVDVVLGLIPKYSLNNVLSGDKKIDEVVVDAPGGIQIISGGSGIMNLVDLEKYQLENLVSSLDLIALGSDYILIDTGAGLSSSVMSFIEASNELVMVITPDPTSITDAYAVVKNIHKKDRTVKVVINRVDSNKEGFEVYHKINSATKKFLNFELESLGFIYEDQSVKKAVRNQKPFILENPNSLASKGIDMIAYNIVNDTRNLNKINGFSRFINKLINSV